MILKSWDSTSRAQEANRFTNVHASYLVCCCCYSVTQSYLTLCNFMDCSMPGFPVLCDLLEFAQTHVCWIGDAIQTFHPLPYPSPPAFKLSSSIRVFYNELTLHTKWPNYWSFSFTIGPSNVNSGLISFTIDWYEILAVKGLSRVFSNTTVKKHQFFGIQPSLWSNSHIRSWLLEKP